MNKSNVTRQLEKLKNNGMIEIQKDPEDDRVCRVYLTDKAKASRPAVDTVVEDWNKTISKNLSENEIEQLKALLQKALTAAKEAEE